MKIITRTYRRLSADRGQSIVEFAVTLPLMLLVSLGVVETSNALMRQHVTTKMAREGSNMISRNTELADAGNALRSMSSNPAQFNSKSLVIFTVLMRSQTGTNNGQIVIYQRYQTGNGALGGSQLNGSCSTCTAANDYTAANPNNTTSLRVTNAPPNVITVPGGMIYVTEVYQAFDTMTPVQGLAGIMRVPLPPVLYSIAYF
ncbi:MAG TPA: TadE/TadG family type IV pilus assembly protein [Vicinamibacterales bacterium]